MRRLTRRQLLAAVALAVVALMFISLDFAGGSLGGTRGGVTGALGSLYRGTDSVLGPARRFVQGVPDVGHDRTEIAQLQQRNTDLQRQLAAATADAATAKRLKTLQLQATSQNWSVLPARVVATGPGAGFQWTVTVDVGTRDHVLLGQTVTDGYGLVGRVIGVHTSTSEILLAADPSSGIGVRDVRTGELLLATGAASSGLTASPLDDKITVRKGDRLVTGPVGQTTYVPGIAVGTVTGIRVSPGGAVAAAVTPAADQTGLDLLGIVLTNPRDTARAALAPGGSG